MVYCEGPTTADARLAAPACLTLGLASCALRHPAVALKRSPTGALGERGDAASLGGTVTTFDFSTNIPVLPVAEPLRNGGACLQSLPFASCVARLTVTT